MDHQQSSNDAMDIDTDHYMNPTANLNNVQRCTVQCGTSPPTVSSVVKPTLDKLWEIRYPEILEPLEFCQMWEIPVLERWNHGLDLDALTPQLRPEIQLFFSPSPSGSTIHKITLLPRTGDMATDTHEQAIFLDYWHCLLKWAGAALRAQELLLYSDEKTGPVPRLDKVIKRYFDAQLIHKLYGETDFDDGDYAQFSKRRSDWAITESIPDSFTPGRLVGGGAFTAADAKARARLTIPSQLPWI